VPSFPRRDALAGALGRLPAWAVPAGACLLIAAMVVVVQLQHIRGGGFYFDDWKNAGLLRSVDGSGLELIEATYELPAGNQRLMASVYVGLTYGLLGFHQAAHLLAAALVSACFGGVLLLLLREIGLPTRHAFAVGALAAIFPFADTVRHWAIAAVIPFSLIFLLGGVTLGQRALRTQGRRRFLLHAAACAGIVLSTLAYEASVPLLAAAAVLHLRRAGLRAGGARIAADGVSALAALAYMVSHQPRTDQRPTLEEAVDHAVVILEQIPTVLARAIAPLGDPAPTAVPLALAAAVVAAGAVVAWRSRDAAARRTARGALAGGALAAFALLLGYVVFVAGMSWYVPLQPGQGNRTNAVAAVGYAGLVWAVAVLLGTVAAAVAPRARSLVAPGVAGLALALLLAGYANDSRDQGRTWNRSTQLQEMAMDWARRLVPNPAPGTHIAFFGLPWNTAQNIPVFNDPDDLSSSLQLNLRTADTQGWLVFQATPVTCARQAMTYDATYYGFGVRQRAYDQNLVVIDLLKQKAWKVRSRRECTAVLRQVMPGPAVEGLEV
jgi:hypothetical protein